VLTPFNAQRVYDWIKLMVDLGADKLSVAAYNRTFFRHRDDLFLDSEDRDLIAEQCSRARADFPELKLRISGLSSALKEKEQEIASKTVMEVMSDGAGKQASDKMEKWKNRTHCSGGRSSIVVTPDGKVVLCDTVPQNDMFMVGDLSKQSIMEVWNSEKLLEFAFPSQDKFIDTLCYGCTWINDCHNSPAGYCFRNSYFNYGTIFGPPPECPINPDDGFRYE
jgi:radical SAM protein with 4Fe4S-binding SPASM domain